MAASKGRGVGAASIPNGWFPIDQLPSAATSGGGSWSQAPTAGFRSLTGACWRVRDRRPCAESSHRQPLANPTARDPKPDMTGSAYSITSSARARINGGIVRPSAPGGLEVDDEIECGRLLNRKISTLSSLQDAVDIASIAAKDVENAGAVGDEQAPRRTRGRR